MYFFKFISKSIKILSSPLLSIFSLCLLFLLGLTNIFFDLYLGIANASQKIMSTYFIFYTLKPNLNIPVFPGGFTILIILFVNIFFLWIKNMKSFRSNLLLWITKLGILILIISLFFNYYFSERTKLHMKSGQNYFYAPYNIKLKNYSKLFFPKSNISKNAHSNIIIKNNLQKKSTSAHILINRPLYYSSLRIFQAPVSTKKTCTFYITQNHIWFLPYLSYFLIFLGLFFQFSKAIYKVFKKRFILEDDHAQII